MSDVNHLSFCEPSMRWDEGLPLGNGLCGAMIWGDGRPLKLSLDRNDLWDLRLGGFYKDPDYNYETMREWVVQNRMEDLYRVYEKPYEEIGATKLPAGRLEISFDKDAFFKRSSLDVRKALASIEFAEFKVTSFVHANEPVIVLKFIGAVPEFFFETPDYEGLYGDLEEQEQVYDGQPLHLLGYKNAERFELENCKGFVQKCNAGFAYSFAVRWECVGDHIVAVVSSATTNQGEDVMSLAINRCDQALKQGYGTLFEQHCAWWERFWSQSNITIPNAKLQKQWILDTYKFGSACRENCLPASLQGPWTEDNGKLPPWRGDYHHDLNTQLCYWSAYSGNHLEQENAFIEWLWNTRDKAREWTEKFFDRPGLAYPMTVDAEGKPIGGWHQYTCSTTTSAWLAQHFYLHWQYSNDEVFLKERAYPFISEVAIFLEAVTEFDCDGKRFLPLSSSPEMYDNSRNAWFDRTTNYDLSLIRFVFEKAAELAYHLDEKEQSEKWLQCLNEMPEIAVSGKDGILLAESHPLQQSHRHHSHLLSIYPLGLYSQSRAENHVEIIERSLETLKRKGTQWWTGYSFAWYACLAARARKGGVAEKALEIFSDYFCLKNSLHCNGDYLQKGYSNYTYRPFTLEGNCAAAAAIQEMLLQSDNGVVHVFPAIPSSWKDVAFENLRAEGAFTISATMQDGNIAFIKVRSEKTGRIQIKNPFGDREVKVDGSDGELNVSNDLLLMDLNQHEEVTIQST